MHDKENAHHPTGAPDRTMGDCAKPNSVRSATCTASTPAVTVVIPTRGRPDSVVRALETVLANDYEPFWVRLVDQSEDNATEAAVKSFLADGRVHYTRTATKGLSAALNCGIARVTSEYVAITGDDCEAPNDWLKEMVAPFLSDPRIAIVFGNVLPGQHDPAQGFVPSYVRHEPLVVGSICNKHRVSGTSACMALRRSVWQALGGFDEMLGVGAPLRAAEEVDFTIRALLAGQSVYETPLAAVVHHGFFRWKERLPLLERNWYGTGAAMAKFLRQDPAAALLVLGRLATNWLRGRSPVAAGLGPGPRRWPSLSGFIRGFVAGALTPRERNTGYFRLREHTRRRP